MKVLPPEEGKRIDAFLAEREIVSSRSFAARLILAGKVKVDGKQVSKNYRLKAGQQVEVEFEREEAQVFPENLPVKVYYEDEWLAVVEKPAGMVVHLDAHHQRGTLVNFLFYRFRELPSITPEERKGIVHRLDKDTSGLLIVAKRDKSYLKLVEAFRERKIDKSYLALLVGEMLHQAGEIEAPLGKRMKSKGFKIGVNLISGKEAMTQFEVRERLKGFTFVEVKIKTGRTHQIRAHFSFLGYPVAGDRKYGGQKAGQKVGLKRQFLHAYRLSFIHPITSQKLNFKSELPQDLQSALELARKL